ncbi:hypothetical protein MAR_011077 [Mya arenaria]|uniref:Uncharacterized protein n=1 Tax=Mya arenaria TaxID=6604 RepID=A0ABY7FWW7_MYAAR|nr:hypothetical protein MAR_011077 [Mya arenaria]
MSNIAKMGQILALIYGVVANPSGAATSDTDGATYPKQSPCDKTESESDPSGSESDNIETESKTTIMTCDIQSAKTDEDYYTQTHFQHISEEFPKQSHGTPGPPRTATFTDSSKLYSTLTLEQDQLPSNNEYEKPSNSERYSWKHIGLPVENRSLDDLKTEIRGECSDENQKKKHIRFKEETKQPPNEDLKELIRQAVKEKFALGKPEDVKFFDAAIVYDKRDYDKAEEMRLEMKQIIRTELQEDLRIELFDSENFSQSIVMVVEDVVDRAFVILVYLSRNTDNSSNVRLFVEEAVGLTRLNIPPPGSMQINDRQYLLKPVHTEPPGQRYYKTPVGLVTMNGIDWYDKYSKFTQHKLVEIMKSAIEKRKQRNRKYGSPIKTYAHRIQTTTDNMRAGQSAFTQGPHQPLSTDNRSPQVTNTSNLGNCQYANAPYSDNEQEPTEWSMSGNQGSAFSSYRSSTQTAHEGIQLQINPEVGTRTAYLGQLRSSTDRSTANQRGCSQQPDALYANYVPVSVAYDQQQINGRQANAMPILQQEMSNYLLRVDRLPYNEHPQDYLRTDQHYYAHSYQMTQPRVEDYEDVVNQRPQLYQYPPETNLTKQLRRDNQQTTGHVAYPRYEQPLIRQPPMATQFQAGETFLRTPHQLPTETQFKARKTLQPTFHETLAEAKFQARDSGQPTNRLPPADPVPLSHDARYSTDRNFDTALVSDLSTNDVEIDTRPSILLKTNFESRRKSKRSRKKKNRRKDGSDSDDDPPLEPFRDLLKSSGGRAVNIIGKITQIGNNNKVDMHKEYVIGNEGESEKNEEENRQTTNDFAKGSIETVSDIFENMDAVDPRKASTRNKGVGNYCGDKKISYQSNISDRLAITGQKQEEVNTSSESNELHKTFSSLPPTSTEHEAVSSDSELFGSGSEYSLPSGSISSRSSARTSFETVSSSTPSDIFVSSTSKESGLSSIVQRAYNMNIKGHSSTEVTVDSDVD